MAKVKETKVALKGEDPKKAPKASKTARKVPPHHDEVKVESDSDSSKSGSNSGSESDSNAEKRKSTKKPKVARAKETEPNDPPVPDDSSDDDSSDDDSSSEADVMKDIRAAAAKKTPAAKKASAPATVSTKGAVHKSKETVSSSSESEEESADEGAAKPTAEVEDSDEEMGDAPAATVAPARERIDPTKAIAPQPFNPPAGYKPLDTKKTSAKTLASLLSNPGQKQIWHITAPSSVPLSQIQSISLASIQNQTPVLSYQNTNYTLAEEKESKTTKKVLIPGDKGYASSEVPVSKSLVLQQVISLPNLPKHQESTAAPQSVLQRGKREPRPQPKGLRMRYKPLGYGAGEPGAVLGSDASEDEDVEMGSAPAFRAPNSAQADKEEKKRKRDAEEAAATPRTEKKRRKEKEASSGKKKTVIGADDADADQVEILAGKEEGVKRAENALVEGTMKAIPETTEEKDRKKAEKKERKSKEKKARK